MPINQLGSTTYNSFFFRLFFIFYFLTNYCFLPSQNNVPSSSEFIANVQHFTTLEGLSHRDVFSVIQDSRGFIWMGTRYGLNRFDGHHFKVFTKEKHGLANNEVNYLLEDAGGWLWVFKGHHTYQKVNFSDISLVNVYTKEVKTLENYFGDQLPFKASEVFKAISDDAKTLYFGTEDGRLIRFRPEEGFTEYPVKDGEIISLTYKAKNGEIVAENITGDEERDLLVMDSLGNVKWKMENSIYYTYLLEDKNGVNWLRRNEGTVSETPISMLYQEKGDFNNLIETSVQLPRDLDKLYYREEDNTFWVESKTTFYIFQPERGILFDFNKNHVEISQNDINDIYFDNRGNVWVATAYGVYKVQLKTSPFSKYLSQATKNYSINSGISCRGIMEVDKRLFVNSVNPIQYQVNLTTNQSKVSNPFIVPTREGEINPQTIMRPVIPIGSNQLLFAGREHVLFNLKEESYRVIPWKQEFEYVSFSWTLFQDSKEKIWAGLHQFGLGINDGDSLSLFKDYNEFESLGKSSVYSFRELDADHLLIGSTSGIYVLNNQKGIVNRFWTGGKEGHYLPYDNVYHINGDKENKEVLWVATGGGGLIKLKLNMSDVVIEEWEQFTITDGLSSNVIYAVYEDEHENLWIPGDYGIIRFDKNTYDSKAFLEEDGIAHNEFNRTSHFKNKEGRLYFGGINGVTAFYPEQVLYNQKTFDAPLEVTNYQLYDESDNKMHDLTTDLIADSEIVLKPSNKFFSLEFALLEYQDANQVRYSYLIEGLGNEWIYLNDNTLRISGVPYGYYTLRIKGQGVTGEFSTQELSIPVTVVRPIYLQWWFISTLGILFIGAGVYWYKQRTRQLKQRQIELEQAVEERTAQIILDKQTIEEQAKELKALDEVKSRFFANVSHELRTPLTLMLAPIESTLKRNRLENQDFTNLLLAQRNGQRLGKMINEILDLTKLESGKLELHESNVTWYIFLRRVVANFESLANRKKISLEFQYEGNKDLQVKLDKEKLEIILVNLLSNAFKFTPNKGVISFIAKDEGDQLSIEVKDTGRGIHEEDLPNIFDRYYQTKRKDVAAEGGTGIGLALSKELVRLMNGSIKVESQINKGTTFKVTFPKVEIISQLADQEAIEILKEGAVVPQEEEVISNVNQVKPIGKEETSIQEKVLIVEDNNDLRTFIQSLLTPNYEVLTAENGKEALEKLSGFDVKEQPSLIVSDVMMPIMDGFQLIENLKSSNEYKRIPVIMLTARAEMGDKLKALRIGVDDYMTKPFTEEELLVRIANLIKHSRWRQEFNEEVGEEQLIEENKAAANNSISEEDSQWLEELENLILEKLGSFDFSVEQLASDLATSRFTLYRRLKQLTGLTATQYLQEARLNLARDLLEKRKVSSVKALAYDVGIRDVKYFSKNFKKRFGKSPSEYL